MIGPEIIMCYAQQTGVRPEGLDKWWEHNWKWFAHMINNQSWANENWPPEKCNGEKNKTKELS